MCFYSLLLLCFGVQCKVWDEEKETSLGGERTKAVKLKIKQEKKTRP